eukprot:Skav217392  [mRNA]  locus=scaffold532:298444:298710:- [translate_table: standard]
MILLETSPGSALARSKALRSDYMVAWSTTGLARPMKEAIATAWATVSDRDKLMTFLRVTVQATGRGILDVLIDRIMSCGPGNRNGLPR